MVAARFTLDFHGVGPVIDFRDAKSDWAIAGLIGQQRWSRPFFEALGDSLVTGPTLTNVNDFRAILIGLE